MPPTSHPVRQPKMSRHCLTSPWEHSPCVRAGAPNQGLQTLFPKPLSVGPFRSCDKHSSVLTSTRERTLRVGSRRCHIETQPPPRQAGLVWALRVRTGKPGRCGRGRSSAVASLTQAMFSAPGVTKPWPFLRPLGQALTIAQLLAALCSGGLGPTLGGLTIGITDLQPTWP